MQTIGSRLAMRRGVAPGFDFLRLFLAVSVVAWHSLSIGSGTRPDNEPYIWVLGWCVLSAFFGLSGFLISASAQRLSLGNFLVNRGLRIVPALSLEIVLSALILGPIFTTLPLHEYFASGQTWRYFTNIVGLVNYHLPGVFAHNHETTVNTSIWTVPHELMCYALISALIFTRKVNKPVVIGVTILAMLVIGISLSATGLTDKTAGLANEVAYRAFVGPSSRLYVFFLAGILFYLCRDRIVYSLPLCLLSVLTIVYVGHFGFDTISGAPFASFALVLPVTYLTAFLGVTDIWLPSALRKGDYSYGIYLYGWPFQQIVCSLRPGAESAVSEFLFSLPLILLFSVISWHWVERPILQLRKKFSFVARVRLEETAPSDAAPVPAAYPLTTP